MNITHTPNFAEINLKSSIRILKKSLKLPNIHFYWEIKIMSTLLFLHLLKCPHNLNFPIKNMIFGHFDVIPKYMLLKNGQHG